MTVDTTIYYWDCECESNYIHPKSEHECKKCGAFVEEQPDSRRTEVKKLLTRELNGLVNQLDHCFGRYELREIYRLEGELIKLNNEA